MIANLPMYDLPPLRAAHDRYWTGIRAGLSARGIAAPAELARGADDLWPDWQSPDLILSQTCGFPYRARLHGMVALVGTPDYGLPGCSPGHYCSVLVARADDPRDGLAAFDGATLAYNEPLSQSGWAAPINAAADLGIRLVTGPRTGAHLRSAVSVAGGQADLAAIDALTWTLATRHGLLQPGLCEVGRTPPTPTLPYISAMGTDTDAMFAAVTEAIAGLDSGDRDLLHLRGFVRIPAEAYLAVPIPPPPEHFSAKA